MNKTKKIIRMICSMAVLFISFAGTSQDTFSIIAVDAETGEVGSAGASCVDLSNFAGLETGFLGELFPGEGAINSQAAYTQSNQVNARNRFNTGDTPQEIIDWLVANDVQNQPQQRQYGIVRLIDGSPQSAAHTGVDCFDYKNHITGPNYSIQGNILLGQGILDSMEARFLRCNGDLSCKLMAAMQGANVIGADNRCTDNGTSSLFAFLKVAQPNDSFGNPTLSLGVEFQDGQGIEPIDRLQIEFDNSYNCATSTLDIVFDEYFNLYPIPTSDQLTIEIIQKGDYQYKIIDLSGKNILEGKLYNNISIDLSTFTKGNYILKIYNEQDRFNKMISKK